MTRKQAIKAICEAKAKDIIANKRVENLAKIFEDGIIGISEMNNLELEIEYVITSCGTDIKIKR